MKCTDYPAGQITGTYVQNAITALGKENHLSAGFMQRPEGIDVGNRNGLPANF